MKKAMISQPMRGLTDEEILEVRNKIKERLELMGYEVVDTFFNAMKEIEVQNNPSLFLMAKSIEAMSKCDTVYFARGWEEARGCRVERKIAEEYGLNIIVQGTADTE